MEGADPARRGHRRQELVAFERKHEKAQGTSYQLYINPGKMGGKNQEE